MMFSMKRLTALDVREMVSRLVADHGTQAAAAEFLGVSPVYVSDVLRKRRAPGDKLLKKLGIKRVAYYEAR